MSVRTDLKVSPYRISATVAVWRGCGMDYKSSGVDQDKANRLVTEIKHLAATITYPDFGV